MSVSEAVLRNYTTHGNSLLLTILNHVIHQQFNLFKQPHWPWYMFSKVLSAASKFDVLDTSPELQHKFCELWNQVIRAAPGWEISWYILRPIHDVYLTLHLHTDSAPTQFSASMGNDDFILYEPSTYPLCNTPGHHPDMNAHIHDDSTSMPIPHPVLHDDVAPVPSSFANTSDVPSPPLTTPAVDVPLLDYMLVPAPSSNAHQMGLENAHGSDTSPEPAAVFAAPDNPSTQTMPATCEASTSTTSILPLVEVSFQNNEDLLVHSSASSSASPPRPSHSQFEVV